MYRRRLADLLEDQIVELERRIELLSGFNGANDASLQDEIQGIYDLLPNYRERLRKELAKRAKIKAS